MRCRVQHGHCADQIKYHALNFYRALESASFYQNNESELKPLWYCLACSDIERFLDKKSSIYPESFIEYMQNLK